MALVDTLLASLDLTTVIVFLLVFLIGCNFLATPTNLPPGPRGLPVVGNVLSLRAASSDMLGQLRQWHQQYGNVFRLRMGDKNMVFVDSYKILQETFVKRSDVFSGRPTSMFVLSEIIEKTGTGVVFADGPLWKELRRVTLMTMRDFGVGKKTLEQRVQEEARAIVEVIEKGQGQPIALKPLFSKFSCNVICSVIFGNRFDYEDATFVKLTQMINTALGQPVLFFPVNFFSFAKYIPPLRAMSNNIVDAMVTIDDFVGEILKEHEATYDPDDIRDFVDLYIKTRSESPESHIYTAANMRRVIIDLFAAGTETSSTAVDWLTLLLVAFPEVQTRCQEQVDKVLGQDRLVTMEDRKDLPYIEAVITEMLRFASIAPLGVPHVAVKEGEIEGYQIPAGTLIMPHIRAVHHNPEVWAEPHQFRPERFLDQTGRFCPPKDNFLPFSIGPRQCLGEIVARMEIFVLFTTLIQSFTFTMGPGQKPDLQGRVGVTFSPKTQALIAKRR